MRGDEGFCWRWPTPPSVVTGAITRSRRDPQWLYRRVYCAGRAGIFGNVGELLMTECEMVNGFIDPRMSRRTSRAATGWCSA